MSHSPTPEAHPSHPPDHPGILKNPSSPGTTATDAASSWASGKSASPGQEGQQHRKGMAGAQEPQRSTSASMQQQATSPAMSVASSPKSPKGKNLSVFAAMFGECLCADAFRFKPDSAVERPHNLYLELDGIECIGLGSVEAEQTSVQRVRETIDQLGTEPARLVSVGYLVEGTYGKTRKNQSVGFAEPEETLSTEGATLSAAAMRVKAESVPLEIYEENYPGDIERTLNRRARDAVGHLRSGQYRAALDNLRHIAQEQRKHPNKNDNKYLIGMTLHNMGVVHLLDGNDDSALPLFQEAAALKKAAYGPEHPEVAVSLDEIGIQYFAREQSEEALRVFQEAKKIRVNALGSDHPKVALVLNNIGCVYFQQKSPVAALTSFQEAADILQLAMGSSATADLDLLHVATTLCNLGYMKFRLKNYDEAQATFEDALLVQQSVLGDNHKTIKDTLSNIALANAFHS